MYMNELHELKCSMEDQNEMNKCQKIVMPEGTTLYMWLLECKFILIFSQVIVFFFFLFLSSLLDTASSKGKMEKKPYWAVAISKTNSHRQLHQGMTLWTTPTMETVLHSQLKMLVQNNLQISLVESPLVMHTMPTNCQKENN